MISNEAKRQAILHWKKLLNFVDANAYSDFYRERFRAAGFDHEKDFATLSDISKIPFLTRADLMTAGDTRLCFVPEEQVEIVAATSGTSSNNPLLAYHVPDPDNMGVYEMNTTRRMLILMHPTRAGHILQRLNRMKLRGLIGDIHNLPMTLMLAARVGIEEVYTTPTLAIMARKYFDQQPELLRRLQCIRLVGEPFTPHKKQLLHQLYPGIEINGRYGSAEADRIAHQCEPQGRTDANEVVYHIIPSSFYYEIVDLESDTEVPRGNKGELVITTFSNLGTPLIRYRTGDLATLHERDCVCGQHGPLLEIHGRVTSDSVRAGGFDFKIEMVDEVMLRLRHIVHSDFEVRIFEDYLNDKPNLRVVLNLSLLPGVSDNRFTRESVIREFQDHWRISPTMSFKTAMSHGLFHSLDVEFIEFPYSAKPIMKIVLN